MMEKMVRKEGNKIWKRGKEVGMRRERVEYGVKKLGVEGMK